MKAIWRRHTCLLSVLLLSACTQQPQRESLPERPLRESIAAYTLEGRVSVRRGESAQNAGLVWQHAPDSDRIELSGPLGQRVAQLSRDAAGARMETSAREVVTAPDWSVLSERVLGASLPLDDMARWLIGVADGNSILERDGLGRPLRAGINGWQIGYLRYESGLASALPTLIDIRRDDIHVRLKVDQWQID